MFGLLSASPIRGYYISSAVLVCAALAAAPPAWGQCRYEAVTFRGPYDPVFGPTAAV